MLILAFESTAKAASCALVKDGKLITITATHESVLGTVVAK